MTLLGDMLDLDVFLEFGSDYARTLPMDATLLRELPRLRLACYSLAVAAALVFAIFCSMLIGVLIGDRQHPQFPYEIAIAICGMIYFFGVAQHTFVAARLSRAQADLPKILRYLSNGVIAFFLALAVFSGFILWLISQPAY